jgi:threonine synthase
MTAMSEPTASVQRCDACAAEYDERDLRVTCARCEGLLALHHPPPNATGAALRARFDARLAAGAFGTVAGPGSASASSRSGVWRFRELVFPGATSDEIVSQPEGNTPLLARAAISRWAGADDLWVKHDGFNPTGSFKDRGMTAALTQACRAGARAVSCASTGNTSASLAAYAALAGLPALVMVPASQVAMGKLAQTLAYGARTLLVRGDFDDCLRLVRDAAERLGVYMVNSINPYRIEGQKSVAFEILQQFGWEPPDWIVLPAGNLGNTSAVGAALRDALRYGLIARMPRVASVQAAGAAPFAAGFRDGFAQRHTVRAETVATAIRIGDPASWDRAVRVIRETDGVVLDVSDAEILEAKAAIDAAGVGCEPASAASVAGVRRLLRDGTIAPGARVVAILTGHVLKDPGALLEYHREGSALPLANAPIEVDASVDAVARVLDDLSRRRTGA